MAQEEEVWRPAKYWCDQTKTMLEFNDYEVSNLGRVRERIGPSPPPKAPTKRGPPAGRNFRVVHLNGNKLDNALSNLKWVAEGEEACCACRATKPVGEILMCAGCRKTFYCNRECQTKDWKKHKRVCCGN